jgi:hypothetical protein
MWMKQSAVAPPYQLRAALPGVQSCCRGMLLAAAAEACCVAAGPYTNLLPHPWRTLTGHPGSLPPVELQGG